MSTLTQPLEQCGVKPRTFSWGTAAWAAPERLRGGPASCAADVFSFGILLYEVGNYHHNSIANPFLIVRFHVVIAKDSLESGHTLIQMD
jgi:serine/threonine protein kinase